MCVFQAIEVLRGPGRGSVQLTVNKATTVAAAMEEEDTAAETSATGVEEDKATQGGSQAPHSTALLSSLHRLFYKLLNIQSCHHLMRYIIYMC